MVRVGLCIMLPAVWRACYGTVKYGRKADRAVVELVRENHNTGYAGTSVRGEQQSLLGLFVLMSQEFLHYTHN